MSRAFVKENDDQPEDPGDLPSSPHPNYVTRRGLELLREREAAAQKRVDLIGDNPLHASERVSLQRELRRLRARIGSAIEVDPAQQPHDSVQFGACVDVMEVASGAGRRWRIVGEDEADPAHGLLSWVSPLARALHGAKVGDIVIWHRPAGDLEVEIEAVFYDP